MKTNKPAATLHFDITERCNLTCIHCRMVDHGAYEISVDDARKIINDTKEAFNITSFTIGGGEPLLRKDWIEFAKAFKEEIPEAMVGVTSNGLLLTEEDVINMKGVVDSFQVSIDGSTPEIHDVIRQSSGSFVKAVKAIKLCQKHNLPVSVRTTLMKNNLHDISNILDKLVEWDVRHFGIRRVLPQGNALMNWGDLSPDPKEYIDVLKMIMDRLSNVQPKIHFWGGDPIMNIMNFKESVGRALKTEGIDMKSYLNEEKNHFKWYSGCAPGFSYLYVTSSGEFCPCPMLPTPLGNALKEPLPSLAKHNIIQRIKIRSFSGECGKCPAKYICGGCRASAYHTSGDLLGEDPTCPLKYGYNLDALKECGVIADSDMKQ